MKLIATIKPLVTQLASIDWSAPWWQPWRSVGQRVAAQVVAGAQVYEALNTEMLGQSVRFAPQSALTEGTAYEAFIYRTLRVPTRENLHDFFNGLAWVVFPHIKRRLNALQAGEIQAHGVQTTRGALRDALTLFDENAALWPVAQGAPTELLDALRQKQWQRACIDLRGHWPAGAPVLFGHALLEKLVSPYKSVTAHVYIARAATNLIVTKELDHLVAQQLGPTSLVPKPFIALPVLGVPGWWAANSQAQFYDDAQVFRAPREILATAALNTPST
jgi:Protein of unknown function (DUF3025)